VSVAVYKWRRLDVLGPDEMYTGEGG
jgi:hypothetical protein